MTQKQQPDLVFGGSNSKGKRPSFLDCFIRPTAKFQGPGQRQAKLLAWILLFVILFSIITLLLVLVFNPHHDPHYKQYALLIGGLTVFLILAYVLNCIGYYKTAARFLVACAALTPWASLLFDPSILQGDFVPLTYISFSILISSIFSPTLITILLAVVQFTGLALVLLLRAATQSFNWFGFLAFIFLTSVFSILANSIIQGNMKQIADQAHQLILNQARLQELSIRDHLTGLFNRRYLEEMLERELLRATRARRPVGIIILDVDNFKQINDTLGHGIGDVVLRELGKFISSQVRQSDVACRYGGDEFVLILPDTSRDTAKERAEKLRKEVKNIFREYKDPPVPAPISISLGVAVFPDDGSTSGTVLQSADAALLQAKHGGSNRVVAAGHSQAHHNPELGTGK